MVLTFRIFRKIRKTKCFVIIVTVIMYIAVAIVTIRGNQSKSNRNVTTEDNFSCFYVKDTDGLPVLDENMRFAANSIFFIESSCRYLNWREACSIESAARANPDRDINVLFTSFYSQDRVKNSIVSVLLSIPNVQIARIHIGDYTMGTGLHEHLKKPIKQNELNMEISDVFKYVTIFKYSGTYLALNVLVTSSFKHYKDNWVVKRDNFNLSSDMFSFSMNDDGRLLATYAFGMLRSHFAMPEKYFDNEAILRKLVSLWCGTTDAVHWMTAHCQGLQVIGPNHVIEMSTLKKYFSSNKDVEMWKDHKIYGYDTWKYDPDFIKESLSKTIAEKYCPLVNVYYGYKISIL